MSDSPNPRGPAATEIPPGKETFRQRWRFALALGCSLLLAVGQPLSGGWTDPDGAFDVFFSLLIVAVLYLVFEEPDHRRLATSLGLIAFVAIWAGRGVGGPAGSWIVVAGHLTASAFFSFALYAILRLILGQQSSRHSIPGAVCGYLLLGIIWGLMYAAVETAFPGSFYSAAAERAGQSAPRFDRGILSYYSFITLSTVGYGDVTPNTPIARTLAWTEAVAGQFYLAIVVAGLVSFKVSQAMKK